MQASVKNIGRVVQRMPSAELLPELQSPDLLPGLFEAFDHHSADVRKAVTMCLMYMWQVSALTLHKTWWLPRLIDCLVCKVAAEFLHGV